MFRGLYISANSTDLAARRIDVVVNNIANLNTTGYKRDLVANVNIPEFPQILLSAIGPGSRTPSPVPNNTGVEVQEDKGKYTVSTNNGFFSVLTPKGEYKSRNIEFKANEEGILSTAHGYPVVGENGLINTGGQPITISGDGTVMVGDEAVDRIKRYNPQNVIGIISNGINVNNVFIKYDQGDVHATGDKFDTAIQGNGFFSLETPDGVQFTRNGNFYRDTEGFLVTEEGYKVLGENGYIKVDDNGFIMDSNGNVMINGDQVLDKLKLVDFKDYKFLTKVTGSTFRLFDDAPYDAHVKAFEGTVKQGYLEGSNVNSVKEMVSLLDINRNYESSQKIIKAYDDLLAKAVNDIGRV